MKSTSLFDCILYHWTVRYGKSTELGPKATRNQELSLVAICMWTCGNRFGPSRAWGPMKGKTYEVMNLFYHTMSSGLIMSIRSRQKKTRQKRTNSVVTRCSKIPRWLYWRTRPGLRWNPEFFLIRHGAKRGSGVGSHGKTCWIARKTVWHWACFIGWHEHNQPGGKEYEKASVWSTVSEGN